MVGTDRHDFGVRPVVSLKSVVRTEGVDENGSWALEKRKSRGIVDRKDVRKK